MPASTVESEFVILDKASRPIQGIRRELGKLEADAVAAGEALDDISGPKEVEELEAFAKATSNLGDQIKGVRQQATGATRDLVPYGARLRSLDRDTGKLAASTERLVGALRELGGIDARPRVNIDGIVEARAELAALRQELRAFGRSSPTATVGVRRSAVSAAAGGGGGRVRVAPGLIGGGTPGGVGGGGLRRVGGALGHNVDIPFVGGAPVGMLAAGLPIAQNLLGAAGAGGAVLGGAGLGAGALGLTGYGTLAAGVGAIAAVALPAKKGLQDLAKAQTQYNAAIQEYGRRSMEAARARQALAHAEAQAPAGGANLLRQQRGLSSDWSRLTRPGQSALTGAGAYALRSVRRAAPTLAGQANRVSSSAGAQARQFTNFALSPQQMLVMRQLSNEFAGDLGYAENTAEHLVTTFGNIARASLPFFHEGAQFVDQWTAGWAKSTGDISATRREIGGYVGDLKVVGRVAGDALKLVEDLFAPAQGPGRGMLQDLDDTLVRWDSWAKSNPGKIETFFQHSVTETEKLAGFVGHIVTDLEKLEKILDPVVSEFTQLGNIAGGAGLLLPTVIRAGAGRVVGGRGSGSGGGSTSGGGVAVLGGGGGGGGASLAGSVGIGYLAARGGGVAGVRSAGSYVTTPEAFSSQYGRYAASERYGAIPSAIGAEAPGAVTVGARFGGLTSELGARQYGLSRVGSAAGGGLEAAGKFVGPLLAVQAGIGGATTQGTAFEKFEGAVNAVSFGLAMPGPITGAQHADVGVKQAQTFVGNLPGGASFDPSDARLAGGRKVALSREIQQTQAAISKTHGTFAQDFGQTVGGGLGRSISGGQNRKQLQAYLKALQAEQASETSATRDAQRQRTEVLNEQSREHGESLSSSLQSAFTTRTSRGPKAGRESQQQALGDVLHSTLLKGEAMKAPGATTLGEQMLGFADDLAAKNPKLRAEVDKFTSAIEKKWKQLGQNIQVVNGEILTGSTKEWNGIEKALTDPAEQALEAVSKSFTAIQQQAIGSLVAMGYSSSDARSLIRAQESGGTAGFVSTQSGISASHGDTGATQAATKRKTGDGPGADVQHGVSGSAVIGGGSSGLMGANADLSGYASLGRSDGLSVTSGLRPGAHTISGGLSYHATGNAIDMAGPNAGMRAFAQTLFTQYGSGLEELITPWPQFNIKDGKPFHYAADVENEHSGGNAHVHVADVDPRGMATGLTTSFSPDTNGPGLVSIKLKAPKSGLAGAPGALADSAMAAYTTGLQQKISDALGGGAVPGGVSGGLTSAGGTYNKAQLAALWMQAGGDPSVANTAAAIALAESAGNANARNSIGATGLWQIYNGPGTSLSLKNPELNAEAAVAKYTAAHGFTPWTTYTGADTPGHARTYLQYMGDGIGQMTSRMAFAGAAAGAAAAGGGGGTVVHFSPQVHVGMSRSAMREEFGKFADEVWDLVHETDGRGGGVIG